MKEWTRPVEVEAAIRRAWTSGSLLSQYGRGEPFPGFRIKLTGPRAAELGAELERAQEWASALRRASRDGVSFSIEEIEIGGRLIGRNRMPGYAILDSYDQAWQLLGVRREVSRYAQLLAESGVEPVVREWALRRPMRALELGEDWSRVVTAFRSLTSARDSKRYLREVTGAGIHTKFIEQHRTVLAELLGVSRDAKRFVDELGLTGDPATVRIRFGSDVGLPSGVSDLVVRRDELAELELRVESALLIENRTTFLSAPVPQRGLVIWGEGFDVAKVGSLSWLIGADVSYWGDIDTHGFAILHRLRTSLPHARSVLMDRATFLEHRDRWSIEPTPSHAILANLDSHELALYDDLVTDRFGERLRLEQEFIDWGWALARLRI